MTYELQCTNEECSHIFEVESKPVSDITRKCPLCKTKSIRYFSAAPPVQFRGYGFHCRDYYYGNYIDGKQLEKENREAEAKHKDRKR